MKKILSMIVAAIMLFSSVSSFAADKEARQPDVYVNDALVEFADQNAYITDEGRTLVPARGVFEALDCEVDWDADNYVVTVTKESQKKEIVLKIDDAEMKIVTDGEEEVKTLEVPAQLMNNRTMIPLRAVSEALGCAIIWNEAEYTITISEMRQISKEEFNEKLQMIFNASQNKEEKETTEPEVKDEDKVKVSLVPKEDSVCIDEEFEVSVKLDNSPAGGALACVKLYFEYDKDVIEYVAESGKFIDSKGDVAETSLFVENENLDDGVTIIYLNTYGVPVTEGESLHFSCKFRRIKAGTANISIKDELDVRGNYTSYLMYTFDSATDVEYSGEMISINKNPITIK